MISVACVFNCSPSMKHKILSLLEDSTCDIFESKIEEAEENERDHDPTNADAMVQALTKEIQGLVNDLELQSGSHGYDEDDEKRLKKSRLQRFKESICGYGTQDTRLPFLYFATE